MSIANDMPHENHVHIFEKVLFQELGSSDERMGISLDGICNHAFRIWPVCPKKQPRAQGNSEGERCPCGRQTRRRNSVKKLANGKYTTVYFRPW